MAETVESVTDEQLEQLKNNFEARAKELALPEHGHNETLLPSDITVGIVPSLGPFGLGSFKPTPVIYANATCPKDELCKTGAGKFVIMSNSTNPHWRVSSVS